MQFITENLGTIIVSGVILLAAIGAILVLRRDKRRGKSSCGYSCAGCPMKDRCHSPRTSGDS